MVNEHRLSSFIETPKDRVQPVTAAGGSISNEGASCLLHQSADRDFLSDLFCFVRRHVEAFVTTAEDVGAGGQPARLGIKRPEGSVHIGQVGVRCVHCRGRKHRLARGAVLYPLSTGRVYQSIRNWQRYHILACEAIPQEVKAEYIALKSKGRSRSKCDATKYWEESCKRMGMVDTADGIQLRNGYFEDGNGSKREAQVDLMKTLPTVSERIASDGKGNKSRQRPNTNHIAESGTGIVGSFGNLSTNPYNQPAKKPQTTIQLGGTSSSLISERNCISALAEDEKQRSNFQPFNQFSLQQDTYVNETLPGPLSNDLVLERVQFALSIVQALRQIRRLPSAQCPLTEDNREDSCEDAHQQHLSQQVKDMQSLGAEVYELFSGVSPYEVDGNGDCEVNADVSDACGAATSVNNETQQQKKRGRRHTMSGYVPLSNLGLPPTLCSLVSSLLDSGAAGRHCNEKETVISIGEVEEDLRLLVSKPGSFLFHTAKGVLEFSPDRLYGCEEQISKLVEAYDHVTDGRSKEIILISGYSGTGKSSLIENVGRRFVDRGACFVSGKFDSMQQMQPLSAVMSAVDDYCAIIAQNAERVHEVREAVRSAIGSEGTAVLASLPAPNLTKIFGPTDIPPVVKPVNGREALRRLVFIICQLFRSTCSCAHPVVLSLDDLQWGDEISLILMQALITDTAIEGLLFIGCFRDNEVGADHPLTMHLSDIRRLGSISVTSICTEDLNTRSVNSLLSDALHLTPRMTQSLAETVLHKTGGNALFVMQFLASLHEDGLLWFSLSSRRWEWDISKIRDREIAENVSDLMAAKLLRMAPEVIDALRVAAAFGARCPDRIFHILDRAPERVGSTATALDIAVAEGIMSKIGSVYRFAHDQVQQAAYQLIPESEREAFHLMVGRLLWKCCSAEEMETYRFVVVHQLHQGSSHMKDHDEMVSLAKMSLVAGEMASAMSAFLPASAYLTAGIGLLVNEDWQCNRDLCFDLYNLCAETEYILGDFDAMQGHLDEVLERGRTLQEKLRAHFTMVQSTGAGGRAVDAINAASAVLAQLGESLPAAATGATVKQEITATATLLSKETEDSLLQLKTMEDTGKQELMKFYDALLYFVFHEKKPYVPVPVCRMVRLSMLHGVCRESAFGFACYGIILCGMGQYYAGQRYARVALLLLDRFQAQEQLAKVHCVVYLLIKPWAEPFQACLPPLKQAVDVGLATGDTQHAMTAAHIYTATALFTGRALGPLMEEMEMHSKQMIEYKQQLMHATGKPFRQATLNLLGRSTDPTKLVGEEMDEESLCDILENSNHVPFLTCLLKMWLEYLFGKYQKAWETKEKGNKETVSKRQSFPALCNNTFYGCLAALALAREKGEPEYNESIGQDMAQMEEWAALTPWNCQNKLELMKAEYAFLRGDFVLAARYYDLAVQLAAKHRFIHEQALALERSGVFHLKSGDHATASKLFEAARDCYSEWGACSKVVHVEESYL